MGLFDRLGRLIKANLNDLVSKAEDPEKILEQSLIDMQEDLIKLRQAVASAIATQKRTQQQYNQAQSEVNNWQNRAQLALQKGDENLAREALVRKKNYADTATTLKTSLDQQTIQVDAFKRNLTALESKISEAKTKKDTLKARAAAAKANEKLQNTISSLNTSSAMNAFERMEEKVLQYEARAGAAAELAGDDLAAQFRQLEGGNDVEDELLALKAQMSHGQLPPGQSNSHQSPPILEASIVEEELNQLRKTLNQ